MNRVVTYPHPGEILWKEFCEPLRISQRRLSAATGVSRRQLGRLIEGQIEVGIADAEKFGRFLGTTAVFWMNLQSAYDRALTKDALAEALEPAKGAPTG